MEGETTRARASLAGLAGLDGLDGLDGLAGLAGLASCSPRSPLAPSASASVAGVAPRGTLPFLSNALDCRSSTKRSCATHTRCAKHGDSGDGGGRFVSYYLFACAAGIGFAIPHYLRSSSAAFPNYLRSRSALPPHCFRSFSALLPHCFRTASALLPHCWRNGSPGPSGRGEGRERIGRISKNKIEAAALRGFDGMSVYMPKVRNSSP